MAIRIRNRQVQSSQLSGTEKTPNDILSLARSHGLSTSPLDLTALCQMLGIGISYLPLDNNLSGRLIHDGSRWVINVNALHHVRRQRFTIAHELAHYFLHRDSQDNYEDLTFHRGKCYTQKELEADNFAGALLMPKDKLIEFVNENSNKLDEIAEYFGTSSIAVKKRADVIRNKSYEF
ncbi:ImmA/IrrE family metallo-endopeptidase [Shewanella sp. SM20]|uniref:ImmA/IrrE family metallo-endopeptidase n=1 Tax=Shewanella sp. SM20 TaxID=2912792 RepID=UPI0021D85504|nr:ImmA/IrrE family metallo-endopeptidase [Shewanella sp. SM20]MCU8090737.1 ImmA/IrrE family metallo-endopeptidase [Shewanella sp. SM20]